MGALAKLSSAARQLWRAQGKCCPICGVLMLPVHARHPTRGWSVEHVWPRSRYRHHEGNLLISHVECNNAKGDRDPTGCELIILALANARLGMEPLDHRSIVRYADQISAPSALALALAQAQAAHG